MADYSDIPDFDSLPAVKGMPQGCCWGVFDKDGKKDHLGTINLITPAVSQAAIKEATEGISVSLNWSIGAIKTPGFSRQGLEHQVLDFKQTPLSFTGFDDMVSFNTQCSSQWDSLVHYGHQPSGLSYNGSAPTVAQLKQDFGDEEKPSDRCIPTLTHWHTHGGLVGRGVLIDYRAYAHEKGIQYSTCDDHTITTKDLEAVAEWEGVTFKQGDVIIVRSGFTEDLTEISAEEQDQMLNTHKGVGVEGSPESAKWFWNHHFAAVAGDALAFEVLPPKIPDQDGSLRSGGINELG